MLSSAADLAVNAALPVASVLGRTRAVLAEGRNLLLVAPPGAGKTTLLPLDMLDAGWRGDGRIVVLEPRRLAAEAAARRMAALLGEAVGGRVGFVTRISQAMGPQTRVEVLTTGILLRRLLTDPGLAGVAAVVLDEVHERSLDGDLALALLLDAQAHLRPDLRLVAMSATAEAAKLGPLMAAELVACEGRAFPIVVEHARRDLMQVGNQVRDLPAAMAQAVRDALGRHGGDLLCFLPGMGDIRRTAALLADVPALVLALHGELPAAEQQRALQPAEGRRVVLATSIAETSLTVPGVRVVIDGGWRRAPRLDAATRLTRLTTMRISRAAADQRAGRAGREAPGVAVRLWTTATQRAMAEHDRPEMLEAELSGLVLGCAAWGTAPAGLRFADAPPAGGLAAGAALLERLGALVPGTAGGAVLTPLGVRMAALGAHPRLAAMMAAGRDEGEQALACDLAAMLEERDFLSSGGSRAWPPSDVRLRVAVLQGGPGEVDRAVLARVRRAAGQYRRRLGLPVQAAAGGDTAGLLAHGFADRIALARGAAGQFRLSGGGSAGLPPTDPLARARLLVVAGLELTGAARITLAAPLDVDDLPDTLARQVTTSIEATTDPVSGVVLARRRRRLDALVLDDRTEPAPAALQASLLAAHAAGGIDRLPWTPAARQLQARVALLGGLEAGWPDMSDAGLAAGVGSWLEPALLVAAVGSAAVLSALDMAGLLGAMLDGRQRRRLDAALPERLALPHGNAAVDYTHGVPAVSARAQAFYGLQRMPVLADGRVAVRLVLLSPAGRPIAVTGDIGAFWTGGWLDARRDMRGRYPRHDWPERP